MQTGPTLTEDHKVIHTAPNTAEEVKDALFSIYGSNALGPDEFGAFFYRVNWDIIKEDVIAAVLETLQSGRILRELNNTTITLIYLKLGIQVL